MSEQVEYAGTARRLMIELISTGKKVISAATSTSRQQTSRTRS
jgi:hypothetical protein